jgi:hypothetical protein
MMKSASWHHWDLGILADAVASSAVPRPNGGHDVIVRVPWMLTPAVVKVTHNVWWTAVVLVPRPGGSRSHYVHEIGRSDHMATESKLLAIGSAIFDALARRLEEDTGRRVERTPFYKHAPLVRDG